MPSAPATIGLVVASGCTQTWQELIKRVGNTWSGQAIAVQSEDPLLVAGLLAKAFTERRELILVHSDLPAEIISEIPTLKDFSSLEGTLTSPRLTVGSQNYQGQPRLGVLTSGTTGVPKLVWHDWDKVSAAAKQVPTRLHGKQWLMCYGATTYAGVQVLLSCYLSGGSLLHASGNVQEAISGIENGAEVVSATPTFWRLLAANWPNEKQARLKQATLGGEFADQATINLVERVFEPEVLTHIYASNEVGTAIIVNDRLAGFPLDSLTKEGRLEAKVVDGRLCFRSSMAMKGYENKSSAFDQDGWFLSEDRVEERDGRLYFLGREDGIVNIGGTKVSLEAVESAIRSLPGVVDCCVSGKKNPITGLLLSAEIILEAGITMSAQEVKSLLSARGPAANVPAQIKFVDALRLNTAGKKIRI